MRNEWKEYKVEKPSVAGPYEWRVKSLIPEHKGMIITCAAHMRLRGAGYDGNVLSTALDGWDGYRIIVPEGLMWREVPEKYKNIFHYDRIVTGIEGLDIRECPFCGKIPKIVAHNFGSNFEYCRNWHFECCDWGKTPYMSDPRKIEEVRCKAFSRIVDASINFF